PARGSGPAGSRGNGRSRARRRRSRATTEPSTLGVLALKPGYHRGPSMSSNDTRDPSATDPSLEQRVEELEIRAAFQERALEELDEVVRQYADKVARLEREL